MQAVILAAGKGTRMLPLTENKPKVMVEVAGKPFLYYVFETLKTAGIERFSIVVGYEYHPILDFLGQQSYWATIIFQSKQRGTGDALRAAKYFTRGEDFIVISGDNLYHPDDIKKLVRASSGNYVTGIHNNTPEKYGVLSIKDRKLVRITEKPIKSRSKTINAALYRFTPAIYDALDKLELSPRGEFELPDAINSLAKENVVRVRKLQHFWQDFGCPDDIKPMESRIQELGI